MKGNLLKLSCWQAYKLLLWMETAMCNFFQEHWRITAQFYYWLSKVRWSAMIFLIARDRNMCAYQNLIIIVDRLFLIYYSKSVSIEMVSLNLQCNTCLRWQNIYKILKCNAMNIMTICTCGFPLIINIILTYFAVSSFML